MATAKKHFALVTAMIMAFTVIPGIAMADTASAASKLSRPTLSNHAASSTSIKNTWKKVKGAKGYEVYRATKEKGKYKKVKTIKSGKTVSWTNKKLKKNKKYYYKVRAYKTANGKKKYSKFSSVKMAKPTNSPNPVFSMSGKSKTTSKISVKITNKGRYSMYIQDFAIFAKNISALEAMSEMSGAELEEPNNLVAKGCYPSETKKVTIKPGKTATVYYTTLNGQYEPTKVKYTSSGIVLGEFKFGKDKKVHNFFASKKYGFDWE